ALLLFLLLVIFLSKACPSSCSLGFYVLWLGEKDMN
ncbi:hypothetical protein A2U01_0108805, partial [Trifolium medium]|nr:hypothetical protein [Trifolium medium]